MIKLISIILFLTMFLSCKDEIINAADDTLISGVDELNVCHSNHIFSGAKSTSLITDISATLHWTKSIDSLGYSIFKFSGGNLEFVKTVDPSKSNFKLSNLQELENYEYIVKSIAPDGQHDCNNSIVTFSTLARQTFSSCNDIYNYYGAGVASGEYEIDMDLSGPLLPINVYCEMTLAGGGWTRLLTHKTASGLFTSRNQALLYNENFINEDLYSIVSYLGNFKRNGKFEFWLHYPEVDLPDEGNHWTQTSNPIHENIAGYTPLDISHTGHFWGGLESGASSTTLFDGSVGHSNWYFAIGSYRYWPGAGTIPGPNNGVTSVMLFIR